MSFAQALQQMQRLSGHLDCKRGGLGTRVMYMYMIVYVYDIYIYLFIDTYVLEFAYIFVFIYIQVLYMIMYYIDMIMYTLQYMSICRIKDIDII